jgi:hypothetical protein
MGDIGTINVLNSIISALNDIIPPILLIAGTFGHLCNLLIFSKRTQRTNPTSLCFLSSTITNLIALYFGMVVRYLQDVANINIVNTNLIMCKLRSFFLYLSLGLSNWYIILATIDRYLISSNNQNRRQLSTLKNAYRSIGLITIIFILSYCHILILYNILTSVCYPLSGPYRVFNDSQLLIQFSLLPPILMTFFGLLTIRNIRLTHQRIANRTNTRIKQRDIQLSKMLLLQVIVTVVCSLPFAITQLTTTVTLTVIKSPLRLAIENFASQIARHLAFLNCSISFYLYTLVGTQFRLELRQFINRFSMSICHRRILESNEIGIALRPMGPTTIEHKRQITIA